MKLTAGTFWNANLPSTAIRIVWWQRLCPGVTLNGTVESYRLTDLLHFRSMYALWLGGEERKGTLLSNTKQPGTGLAL